MQCMAFSYTRFSTLKQEQGDSGRRQIESARKYAAERGYILDESMEVDRGKSAWTGRDISEGALHEFTLAYRVEDDSPGINPDR
jgi:DNA invertase Pin-like site-specific DNA recombinase